MKKLLFLGLLLSGMSVYAANNANNEKELQEFLARPVAVQPAAPVVVDDDDFRVDMFKGPDDDNDVFYDALAEHPAAPAVAPAPAKQTPPPVKPKPKVCKTCHTRPCTCSAGAAPTAAAPATRMPQVRTGGRVQQRWKPGGATQAELDALAAIGKRTAQDLYEAQLRAVQADDDAATQALIKAMRQADLEEQRRRQEANDAALARLEGTRERMAARSATKDDAAFAQKLIQRDQFQEQIDNLQAILAMDVLTEEQIAALNGQIDELNGMILSLGLE